MSNLVQHAETELKLAGLFDKDSDYEGMLGDSVMKLIKTFSDDGHSGFSAMSALLIFDKLAKFENLTPIGNSPDEWVDMSNYTEENLWQCKRNCALFSHDGGKTYYHVDDKESRKKCRETAGLK